MKAADVVTNINETPHLLDLLIAMEDVMDSFDIYVFENWIHGVVVTGPVISRYHVSMTLRYAQDGKPDKKGGLRLMKHGVEVKYRLQKQNEYDDAKYWMVDVVFPRKLMAGVLDSGSEYYSDDIDTEDLEDAIEMGVNDETGVKDANQ